MEDYNIVPRPMNIIFPLRGEDPTEVLLGIKTRVIGVGKWNGWGGKVNPDETIGEAAARELKGESSLIARPEDFRKVAMVDFYIHKPAEIVLNRCDIFFLERFEGTPKESEEMINPTWFPISEVPYRKMMEDAPLWMPQIFDGKNIHAEIHYNKDRTRILGAPKIWKLELN